MAKRFFGFGILAICSVFLGCASTQTTISEYSIIVFTSNSNNMTYRVSINGEYRGTFSGRRSGQFIVPNGNHLIMVEFQRTGTLNVLASLIGGQDADRWQTSTNLNLSMTAESLEIPLRGNDEVRVNRIRRSRLQNPVFPAQDRTEVAITRSFDTLNQSIPNGSRIAILDISPDDSDSRHIGEGLMSRFVNSASHMVVDRGALDTIRHEQEFQMSGEVSDDTAVSVGNFLGADVVITGSIIISGRQSILRLRALDVRTAQILAMSSEEL